MEKHFLIQFLKSTGVIVNIGVYDSDKQGYFTGDGIINDKFDLETFTYKSYTMPDFFELIQFAL